MGDFAIEALNAGASAALMWCLFDQYYDATHCQRYGLWEFKDRDWRPRPAFSSWSLINRYTEQRSRVVTVQCEPRAQQLRGAALMSRDDKLTMMLVNRYERVVHVQLDNRSEPRGNAAGVPLHASRVSACKGQLIPASDQIQLVPGAPVTLPMPAQSSRSSQNCSQVRRCSPPSSPGWEHVWTQIENARTFVRSSPTAANEPARRRERNEPRPAEGMSPLRPNVAPPRQAWWRPVTRGARLCFQTWPHRGERGGGPSCAVRATAAALRLRHRARLFIRPGLGRGDRQRTTAAGPLTYNCHPTQAASPYGRRNMTRLSATEQPCPRAWTISGLMSSSEISG